MILGIFYFFVFVFLPFILNHYYRFLCIGSYIEYFLFFHSKFIPSFCVFRLTKIQCLSTKSQTPSNKTSILQFTLFESIDEIAKVTGFKVYSILCMPNPVFPNIREIKLIEILKTFLTLTRMTNFTRKQPENDLRPRQIYRHRILLCHHHLFDLHLN